MHLVYRFCWLCRQSVAGRTAFWSIFPVRTYGEHPRQTLGRRVVRGAWCCTPS